MGNVLSKGMRSRDRYWVDGGPTHQDGLPRHLLEAEDEDERRQRQRTERHRDYDVHVVESLIRSRKLAPFYTGQVDEASTSNPQEGIGEKAKSPTTISTDPLVDLTDSEPTTSDSEKMLPNAASADTLTSEPATMASQNTLTEDSSQETVMPRSDHDRTRRNRRPFLQRQREKLSKAERAAIKDAQTESFIERRRTECPICFMVCISLPFQSLSEMTMASNYKTRY